MNNTKQHLIFSVLSMVLCIAMLVGTTYAWFTDSVTSGVNTIVAGNLDIELEYWDGTDWVPVDESTLLFDDNALWEPGHTEVAYLHIKNAGTLSLKYKFAVNVADEESGTNVFDQEFSLSDYLVFGKVDMADASSIFPNDDAGRLQARAAVGDTMGLSAYTETDNLYAANDTNKPVDSKTEKYLAFVIYMPESVGNEANYKAGTTAPQITLGVSLVATQLNSEVDSFGSDYDEAASTPEVYFVGSGEGSNLTIQEALALANDGDTIILASGTYNLTESLSMKSISLIGAGADNTIIDIAGLSSGYAFPLSNDIDLSVKNITFKGNSNISGFRASSQTHAKKLEFINCVFEDFRFPIYLSERTVAQGAEEKDNKVDYLTIKGCTFNNQYHVYIGRGVVNSALIEGNTFSGTNQIGIEFYDCWTTRRTGSISFKDNSFTNEYPIVLLTGGPVAISNTNITYDETSGDQVNVVYLKAAQEENAKFTIQDTVINGVMRDLDQVDLSGDIIIYCYLVP